MSSRSKVTSQISRLVIRAVKKRRFRQIVDDVIADGEARDLILHRVGTIQMHNTDRIDEVMPARLSDVSRFDRLLWLFSSNYANRGISLLLLDEALWLFNTVRSLDAPRVAEIGRAKGGTTFLLAAAGATVVSLDNQALEAGNAKRHGGASKLSYDESLKVALQRHGLESNVEAIVGDAITHPVQTAEFDLVFLDVPFSARRMSELFEHWWPGVKPGGLVILRDGREPRSPGVREFAGTLQARGGIKFMDQAPGVFTVLVKDTVGHDETAVSIDLAESKSAKIDDN
jgi:predicted O-methyltransferase YrrM